MCEYLLEKKKKIIGVKPSETITVCSASSKILKQVVIWGTSNAPLTIFNLNICILTSWSYGYINGFSKLRRQTSLDACFMFNAVITKDKCLWFGTTNAIVSFLCSDFNLMIKFLLLRQPGKPFIFSHFKEFQLT